MSIELPKDAYGRVIPLDTGTLYEKNGVAKFIYHYDYDPRGKVWYVETDEGSRSVSELLLDRDDSWEKLLADLKRGASRVHHPECAYFGRDENDCDQCEAVCSFACKKIAFGDIESRIRKLMDGIKLKPCPFCGGDAEMRQGKHQGLGTFYVSCLGCGARTDLEYAEEFAADLWNERVSYVE